MGVFLNPSSRSAVLSGGQPNPAQVECSLSLPESEMRAVCEKWGIERAVVDSVIETLKERLAQIIFRLKERESALNEVGLLGSALNAMIHSDAETQKLVAGMDARIRVLEPEVSALLTAMNQLQAAFHQADAERNRISIEYQAVVEAKRNNPSRKKNTELNAKFPGLRQADSHARTRCQELERELAEMARKYNAARSRLETLRKDREALTEKVHPASISQMEKCIELAQARGKDAEAHVHAIEVGVHALIDFFVLDRVQDPQGAKEVRTAFNKLRFSYPGLDVII